MYVMGITSKWRFLSTPDDAEEEDDDDGDNEAAVETQSVSGSNPFSNHPNVFPDLLVFQVACQLLQRNVFRVRGLRTLGSADRENVPSFSCMCLRIRLPAGMLVVVDVVDETWPVEIISCVVSEGSCGRLRRLPATAH